MSHEIHLLPELLVLAAISLAIVMLFRRLRLPATVGLIVTGVVIGPGGLGLVSDPDLVRTMAEFGVVLLLFTVGLEFSPAELAHVGRRGLMAGAYQVFLTVVLVGGGLLIAGVHPARALFFGALLALSSTALVLKLLNERLELTSPHGRLVTGVLVFQDLMVIPLAIAVPWLARWYGGTSPDPTAPPLEVAFRSIVVLAIVAGAFMAVRSAAPRLLILVARTRSREAFMFGIALVTLGSAWLTSWAGLSLALGAFLAGLILSESELKARIAADVLPLTDGLASVFFISIGMLLTPRLVIDQPLLVLASTIGLVGVKLIAAVIAFRFSPAPWRVALAGGMSLAQVGEFSFVLAAAGTPSGLLGELGGQAFFAGAVFSLILTPLLVAKAPEWALVLERRRGNAGAAGTGAAEPKAGDKPLTDHVVIAGFGLNGQNLARVLRAVRVPHIVVDLNADALRLAANEGSRGLIGDIANPSIQQRAALTEARTLVLALSDPTATRHACQLARNAARDLHIIVRTRYVSEIDELFRLGANQVIPEEFETSIEIFTATLRQFHVPMNVIQAQIALLRQERYSLLRGMKLPGSVVEQLDAILTQGTCDTFLLLQHSPAIGRTLEDMGLDGQGTKVVAIVRGGLALTQFDAELRFSVGDTLVLTGTHAEMERAFDRLSPPPITGE